MTPDIEIIRPLPTIKFDLANNCGQAELRPNKSWDDFDCYDLVYSGGECGERHFDLTALENLRAAADAAIQALARE